VTSRSDCLTRRGTIAALVALCLIAWERPGYATPEAAATGAAIDSAAHDPLFDDFDEGDEPAGFPDPFERMNRCTLRINQKLDAWLLNPITKVYGTILPGPLKRAVRRMLTNVNSPAVMINDLLQREWTDAGTGVARFLVNSTVGVAGIFDPATRFGLREHISDFGQTLALGGVRSGPYLVVPLLGPATARDGFGYIVDALLRPTVFILGPGGQLILFSALQGGMAGIATREAKAEALAALESSSIDYYTALRNAYYQNRVAQIWDRREHHRQIAESARGRRLSRRQLAVRRGPRSDR
jgi:phospholipid-binding lipoprotein MlaA